MPRSIFLLLLHKVWSCGCTMPSTHLTAFHASEYDLDVPPGHVSCHLGARWHGWQPACLWCGKPAPPGWHATGFRRLIRFGWGLKGVGITDEVGGMCMASLLTRWLQPWAVGVPMKLRLDEGNGWKRVWVSSILYDAGGKGCCQHGFAPE